MKTTKKLVLVVTLMFGTLISYANNANDFNTILNAKKVRIGFKNVKKGHLLTVKDDNNVQLHSEIISQKGDLNKIFDFSSLNDGKYTVELSKDFEIVIKTFNVKNNRVLFNNNSKSVIYKPLIRNDENILMISKIDFNKKPLKIVVYYNNEVIYKETIEDNTVLNRVYKLNQDIKGEYSAVVYTNNRSYVKNFKI
ncbi:hypothetical protein [Polaribacter ponticola]|uniref:Secretion system C-terminal sorting domain-containing protein n=1 Tax=Polaribacter ponticola TaxID=2978475 RepID=A0ABT5SC44_9FLAO|nr:hypothetical protein [Polaribacter sp. MSW5]MDD7915650.1 hypothetical protein [Polaribacter sp. MSW5]